MPSAKGVGINCFALLKRNNNLLFKTTPEKITSSFIIEQLKQMSLFIQKQTVLVLDNACVHTLKKIQEQRAFWQERGLLLFYLP